jgi:hypothetical protein
MSKTRDTGFLGNVIKVDTSGNVSFVSGSTTLATINTSGQLSGSSPVLSSSYALNADLLDGLDSTQFTLTSSFAAQTASFTAFTASVNSFTASQLVLNGTYATTGSNTFTGIQTVNSNLVVTGSITAQTLVVQTITSSVDFVTGSTRFGSILANTHVFSGSVTMNPNGLFVSSSGNVGIGTTSPSQKVEIQAGANQWATRFVGANVASQSYGFYVDAGTNATDTNAMFRSNGGSSVYMYIGGDGKVGIGTSTLNSKFIVIDNNEPNITGNITSGTQFAASIANGWASLNVGAYDNGTSTRYGYLRTAFSDGAQTGADMRFYTGPTLRLTIASTGAATFTSNVQIGSTLNNSLSVGLTAPTTDTLNHIFAGQGVIAGQASAGGETDIGNNWYYYSGWKYRFTASSSNIKLNGDVISFERAGSGTANAAITFVESMRITSAGSVGIGTTSPSYKLVVSKGGAEGMEFDAGSIIAGKNYIINYNRSTSAYTDFEIAANNTLFSTAGSERMRITSGGNVLIGSTSDQGGWKAQVTGNIFIRGSNNTSANTAIYIDNSVGTLLFSVRNDGYINIGGGASSPYNDTTATAANLVVNSAGSLLRSTSSLKYKTDVRNYDKGLAEVLQMRPVYYKGKNDGETQFAGLIAEEVHELGLTEFVQYAEDGSPDALAYSNMIALAFKAIQEQQAQINELKAQING